MARQFAIEFDLLDGHTPGTAGFLTPKDLHPVGWRSIGDPEGGTFTNRTTKALSACYLKANNPGDTFLITAESAGRLFKTIWLKNDLTEVYFMDAAIPINSNPHSAIGQFWMRVPRNEEADIAKCNTCLTKPPSGDPDCNGNCPFTGQVFAANPANPPAADWRKIIVQ